VRFLCLLLSPLSSPTVIVNLIPRGSESTPTLAGRQRGRRYDQTAPGRETFSFSFGGTSVPEWIVKPERVPVKDEAKRSKGEGKNEKKGRREASFHFV